MRNLGNSGRADVYGFNLAHVHSVRRPLPDAKVLIKLTQACTDSVIYCNKTTSFLLRNSQLIDSLLIYLLKFCLFICLFVCLFICLFIYLFVYLIYLST